MKNILVLVAIFASLCSLAKASDPLLLHFSDYTYEDRTSGGTIAFSAPDGGPTVSCDYSGSGGFTFVDCEFGNGPDDIAFGEMLGQDFSIYQSIDGDDWLQIAKGGDDFYFENTEVVTYCTITVTKISDDPFTNYSLYQWTFDIHGLGI